MKVITIGAVMLVLLALGASWQALQLIPTDLGNSYLIAASVLFSTAFLAVAFATVGQKIVNEIRALEQAVSVPSPQASPVVEAPRTRPEPPVMAPPPISPPVIPAPVMREPEVPVAPKPPVLSPAPAIAAGIGGAAAGMALGGMLRPKSEPAPDMKLLDELERDLFAELKAPTLTLSPAPDEPEPRKPEPTFEAPAPTVDLAEPLPSSLAEPEDSALLQPTRSVAADTGEDDDLMLPPLPPIPSFGLAPPPEPVPFTTDEEQRAIEDAAHADDDNDDPPAPEPAPEMPASEPAPSTSGLIHDEDYAALSEAEADLAPLDTLEIVGAYDSGGTRFTMYSDGSVTAKGEVVDRRFRSLDDLRAFIDGGMRG